MDAILLDNDDEDARLLAQDELIFLLASQGRKEPLVKLLSHRCPDHIYLYTGIEDLLIIISRKALADGATVLFDAYDQSTDKTAKAVLFEVIQRSFAFTGISATSEQEFVLQCRHWYEANKKDYEPNMEYLIHLNVGMFDYKSEGVLAKKK